MKLLVFVALVACSPRPYRVSSSHPASPAAPIGRLAGPPAALRPGVVDAPAPAPAPEHHH